MIRGIVSIVIPTFNEAENIPALVERLTHTLISSGAGYEILVVDDDSPDKTWLVAETLRLRDRLRRFINFNVVCGIGALINLGLLWLFAIRLRWHYLAVNLFAIGAVTLWNYGLNTTRTWTAAAQETVA